jgi:hypothetical protein
MENEIKQMIDRLEIWYRIGTNSVLRSKFLAAKGYLEDALEINSALEEEKKNG